MNDSPGDLIGESCVPACGAQGEAIDRTVGGDVRVVIAVQLRTLYVELNGTGAACTQVARCQAADHQLLSRAVSGAGWPSVSSASYQRVE